MTYRLDMDRETRVLISHMSPAQKRKIKESFRAIAENPLQGKPLQDELEGFCSYRTGSLRIIYSIDRLRKAAHVVAVGPRRNIYEELKKELTSKKRG